MRNRKKIIVLGIIALFVLVLAGCGEHNESVESSNANDRQELNAESEGNKTEDHESPSNDEVQAQQGVKEERTIQYLDQAYTVPETTNQIVITGSLEAMEDALLLGVEPVGALTVGGEFPSIFAPITESTVSIGEKSQPSVETILELKPEVILSSTKFPAEVAEKLTPIATTIPISHLASNWEENLKLLAELTGKQNEAEQIIQKYNDDLAEAKEILKENLKDQKVVVIRIRSGNIAIYRNDIYFNPTLYDDLGFDVPEEIKNANTQEIISLEKFSEINPDILFVQFAEAENGDSPQALDELQNNPIWKSINAVKNDNVFVNVVDPLAPRWNGME